MTNEQKYFLELVKSHLNQATPPAPQSIDFSALFHVCELQNMTAIAAIELKKIRKSAPIGNQDFSPFNQVLGLTVQNFEYKAEGLRVLSDTFCDNGIRHLFIKGAALRPLYPVPEVRTSGDADVIVDKCHLSKAAALLKEKGFRIHHQTDIEIDMQYHAEEYEIKTQINAINASSTDYFANLFDEKLCNTADGIVYSFKPSIHLAYITLHILKHFKSGGAGIRQLCDMDVLLRNTEINLNEYLALCEQLQINKAASVLLAWIKEYFATPIDFDFVIEPDLRATMEHVLLDGGTFGYGIGDIGTARLMNTMHGKGYNKLSSVRAVLNLFIVSKEFLQHQYSYVRKHPILLPVAYCSRLRDAIFKRRKQNIKHIKSMFSDREIAAQMSDMLTELGIE